MPTRDRLLNRVNARYGLLEVPPFLCFGEIEMRYEIVTLKWDVYEYLGVKDTQTEKIICTEQLEFVAYPECAFIEQVSENGRTYLETICKALNNEH